MTPVTALRIHRLDNVATALADLDAGAELSIDGFDIRLTDPVARGHKVALVPIHAGAAVIKYGFPIGTATAAIAPGAHVHSHNLVTALGSAADYHYEMPDAAPPVAASPKTFQGYVRADGRASYEIVARVMASLSTSGFTSINLITDTGGPSSGADTSAGEEEAPQ